MTEPVDTGNTPDTGAAPGETSAQVPADPTQQQASGGQPAEPAASTPSEPALPEKYVFKDASGKELDATLAAKIADTARELKLTQEAAQKFLESVAATQSSASQESAKAFYADIGGMPDTWAEATKVDPEIGGDKLTETLATAKKALDAFATPALRTLMEKTAFGNNPEMIRFLARAGRALSSDKPVQGGKAPTEGEKSMAQKLYNPPKN